MKSKKIYEKIIKRGLDLILSFIFIILLLPLMIIIALLIFIIMGRPIIFKQKRPGLNGKIFIMYKFRTMNNKKDENGQLLPDKSRLTKFGKFLRKTSLDELPELFNILLGEMSLIGPRPQLIIDMMFMSEEIRTRHNVRPGLTGLAQVNGRNNISWEQKFEYDLEYIKNISFKNDIKILFKTVLEVLKRTNINSYGFETAENFGDYLLRTNKITLSDYNKVLKKYYELTQEIKENNGI